MKPSLLRLVTVDRLRLVKSYATNYLQTFINRDIVHRKAASINDWYTKLLHLDEVKLYQDRVVTLQERLLATQEERREIGRRLAEIRRRSNHLQDEIHKVKRQDDIDKFLQLMKEETEVLKLEHEAASNFQECDRTERELFTAFTNAIRDSHEKQRAQLEYTKYFGIILSIAGSFLAFCYTTIRKDDLKRFIEQSLVKPPVETNSTNSVSTLQDYTEILEFVKNETAKVCAAIDSERNQMTVMISQESDAKRRQFVYHVGITVLFLLIFKVISSN